MFDGTNEVFIADPTEDEDSWTQRINGRVTGLRSSKVPTIEMKKENLAKMESEIEDVRPGLSKEQLAHFQGMIDETRAELEKTITEEPNRLARLKRDGWNDGDRVARFAEEKALVGAIVAAAKGDGECTVQIRACVLHLMMEELYEREDKLEYQAGSDTVKKGDIAGVMGATNYTEANFMYGTTYFPSWVTLFADSHVQAAAAAAQASSDVRPFVILGSTIGWQAFFGALVFQFQAILGFEIVPFRQKIAVESTQLLPEGLDNTIEFRLADALQADLSSSSIVYLTSLGWDPHVVLQLHRKLAQEVQRDAVIVANTFGIGPQHGGISAHLSDPVWDKFVILSVHCVPVSWMAKQEFYVYRLRQPGDNAQKVMPDQLRCNRQDSLQRLKGTYLEVALTTLRESLEWLLQPGVHSALAGLMYNDAHSKDELAALSSSMSELPDIIIAAIQESIKPARGK